MFRYSDSCLSIPGYIEGDCPACEKEFKEYQAEQKKELERLNNS